MPKKRKQQGQDLEAEAFAPPKAAAKAAAQDAAVPETRQDRFSTWSTLVMTGLEKKVWRWLGGKNNPWDFEPQVQAGPYTLDFFSRKYMLCIEADGPKHLKTTHEDATRDKVLAKQGILTLRLTRADFVRHSPQRLFDLVEELIQVRHIAKPLEPRKPK